MLRSPITLNRTAVQPLPDMKHPQFRPYLPAPPTPQDRRPSSESGKLPTNITTGLRLF
jgi:hypothetical protein